MQGFLSQNMKCLTHLLLTVCSNFWAFTCIFQAPLSWLLWSGYRWKDLFLQQNLSTDGEVRSEQWPTLVTASYGWHRSQWVNKKPESKFCGNSFVFLSLLWINFPNLSQKDSSFEKIGLVIWLLVGAFCQKLIFLKLWRFSVWKWTKLHVAPS